MRTDLRCRIPGKSMSGPLAAPVSSSTESIAAAIAGIFRAEIKLKHVGLDDSFFELGGDSLAAETVILAVQERFKVPLQTAVLLEAASPRELAALVEEHLPRSSARHLVVQVSDAAGRVVCIPRRRPRSATRSRQCGEEPDRFRRASISGPAMDMPAFKSAC